MDSAAGVAEGLALLAAGSYNAVITDMKLPDGSGLDVLRWLEQRGRGEDPGHHRLWFGRERRRGPQGGRV